MKRYVLVLCFILVFLPAFIFATDNFSFESGEWKIIDGRLYQCDENVNMAKAALEYSQEGLNQYQFNLRYEKGAFEDGYAGFGIHIFVDEPAGKGRHWGEGNSYLLWMNYDENPESSDIPSGLSAQVYLSKSSWDMELVYSVSLSQFESSIAKLPSDTIVPIKITANKETGEVRVYDPFKKNYYYTFILDNLDKLDGKYVTLRTNSVSLSFGY